MKKVRIIIALIFIVGALALLLWLKGITHRIFINHAKNTSDQTNIIANKIKDGLPFNILLLGYGGGDHDGAYLTDSMMLVYVIPNDKRIILFSIPRDIWIKIPTNGNTGSYWKINAAYELGLDDKDYPKKLEQFKGESGGGNMAKKMVEEVTGLKVDSFLAMDFMGFKKTIDTLGGVDITVEKAFTDPEYPIDGKETDLCGHQPSEIPALDAEATQSAVETIYPCRYENLHFDKGLQHMDGERALSYVRSRHSLQDGTDFGRAKRQRNLLVAVKQKIFTIGFIPKAIPFVTSLQDDLKTDLSLDDAKALIVHSKELNGYDIQNLALTNENYLVDSISDDGQAILLPKDGKDSWGSIHNWFASYTTATNTLRSPIIKVENGTRIAGLAELTTNRLKDKEFNVMTPGQADDQTREKTTIILYNKKVDSEIFKDLENEFGVPISNASVIDEVPYDILIILGNDYNLRQGKKLIN